MKNDKTTSYPFYWLDELVEVVLNPEKTDPDQLSMTELQDICEQLPAEFNRIMSVLKGQAFTLYKTGKVKVVAGHYDQAVRLLLQQADINMAFYPAEGPLRITGQLLMEGLNGLFRGIRERYPDCSAEAAEQEGDLLFKVLCRLSVDQIAIILKAADEIHLLSARSFSQVLRSIVPYLSTERLESFSWKSARSSTYKMEGSDRDVVIRMLEALIIKVKEYG